MSSEHNRGAEPRVEDYVLGPSPADWERLERPLELDPVTFEILRHKLEAINEEQAIALKDVSVSPIVVSCVTALRPILSCSIPRQ